MGARAPPPLRTFEQPRSITVRSRRSQSAEAVDAEALHCALPGQHFVDEARDPLKGQEDRRQLLDARTRSNHVRFTFLA